MGCRAANGHLPVQLCITALRAPIAQCDFLVITGCRGREPCTMTGLRSRLANLFLEFVRGQQAAAAAGTRAVAAPEQPRLYCPRGTAVQAV